MLPAGNLGNTAAFGKALYELKQLGLVERVPRVAAVQAAGASPFYQSFQKGFRERVSVHAETVATAIRIGNPASWQGAVAARDESGGVIDCVTDDEIMAAYRLLGTKEGIFGEPASAASLAGLIKMAAAGLDLGQSQVVCVVTGTGLKDPDTALKATAAPAEVPAELAAVEQVIVSKLMKESMI